MASQKHDDVRLQGCIDIDLFHSRFDQPVRESIDERLAGDYPAQFESERRDRA